MTPPDTLIDSYRAAQKLQEKLQGKAGPSELTRSRILAHAEQLVSNKHGENTVILPEYTTDLIAKQTINTPAANDSQWKICALASVAIFGIAGLLMLQVSRETPDEFLPQAKPPVSAEIQAQTPAAPAAPKAATAPTAAITTPAAAKPAPKLDSQFAKNTKKSEAPSLNDLEVVAPKSEAMTEKTAEIATTPSPPTASAPAAVALAPAAAAPATSLTTMADSAKLSRPASIATRSAAKEATNTNTKLFSAIQTKDAAALKLALDGGDDKNAKNANGTPALSLCVQTEQPNLVRLLIAAGADVNALDADGVSPFVHARNRGFTDIVNLLLNSGAK